MITERLCLGTAQLGLPYGINNRLGLPDDAGAQLLLATAWEHGVRTLDTAPAYGAALERIGAFHRASGRRFSVYSKFSLGELKDKPLRSAVCEQLAVLGLEQLDILFCHRPAELAGNPALGEELARLTDEGLIRMAGISIYESRDFDLAASHALAAIQFPFNILDNMRLRGPEILKAKGEGKTLVARSVFLQGALLFKPDALPSNLKGLGPSVHGLQLLAGSLGLSIKELALRYPISQPEIDKIIIGAESAQQIGEVCAMVEQGALPQEVLEQISNIAPADEALLNPSKWT